MKSITRNIHSSNEDFWRVVKIYWEHPNSINKQVISSENFTSLKFKKPLIDQYENLCHDLHKDIMNVETMKDTLKSYGYDDNDYSLLDCNVFEETEGLFLGIRKLIPKKSCYMNVHLFEFGIIDFSQTRVIFFTFWDIGEELRGAKLTANWDPMIILKYKHVELNYSHDELRLCFDDTVGEKGINWIDVIFCKKFSEMMLNNNHGTNKSQLQFTNMVSSVEYYQLYEKMKLKYGKYLVKNWPENTDPKKYVYEDIGIATYLLLLWNDGSSSSGKQKFVDLGCGNGLLVYILNSEGHEGIGLDIRKRKIWDWYPATAKLKVETVIPSDFQHPEADWLIGNHSDELTAWMPIMADRCNSKCRYFVLPCCPFQLNGKKFQRKNSGLSSYQDFMTYVSEISTLCGFDTYVDKLRIPSTKRICLIGRKRNLAEIDFEEINENIKKFIKEECEYENVADDETDDGTKLIKLRDPVEPVRNCTKIPKDIIRDILKHVTARFLKDENICRVVVENKSVSWNRGGSLTVSELANSIPKEYLNSLKQECKGLQTLLKNNHNVFEVTKGRVQFRHPDNMLEISCKIMNGKDMKWKKKDCWFYHNHPDKCPLEDHLCSYRH